MLLQALSILKIALQISVDTYDEYLTGLLVLAKANIETEGIVLVENCTADIYLVEMYAEWLYRVRRETDGPGMPRALRWALNNRLFSQKAQEAAQ